MKDERVYLGHIRDAINDIKSYAARRQECVDRCVERLQITS